MKRKVTRKLGLSKETLRTLDAKNLDHVAGGLTTGTNPCSVCPICQSNFATCVVNTEGICC